MKSTKNIFFLITAGALGLFGCSSDYDDAMEIANECIEEKFDDEVIKFKSVKDALFAFDFESARLIANCLPDNFYYQNGDLYSTTKDEQLEKIESGEDWGRAPMAPHLDAMIEILRSEVTYYVGRGEYGFAKKACDEMGCGFIYDQAIPNALDVLCTDGKFNEAVALLSTKTFNQSFEAKPSSEWTSNNSKYNDEVSEWNNLLDMVLNKAILAQDEESIPKLLLLYKEIAVKKRENSWYLSDQPKKDALKRVREGKEHL